MHEVCVNMHMLCSAVYRLCGLQLSGSMSDNAGSAQRVTAVSPCRLTSASLRAS